MKVCIDARNLVFETQWAGTTLYTVRLIEFMPKVAPHHTYILYFNFFRGRLERRVPFLRGLDIRTRVLRIPRRYADSICDNYRFPIDLVTGSFDVLHGPAYELLHHRKGRSVVTIHDLTFHLHPEWLGAGWRDHFIQDCRSAVSRADLIITVSNYIKGEVIEHLKVPPEKIITVPHGIEPRFTPDCPEKDRDLLAVRYGLSSPYLLSVATREPKKNLPRLLRAYRLLAERLSSPPRLVLVGKRGWETRDLRDEIGGEGSGNHVVSLGYVPYEDLPRLYRHAELFLFPSLYEGFGMPLLEAMASGCPVLAARAAAIPEVAGDSAVLVDPYDPEAMATEMEDLITDEERRNDLSERGIHRAGAFTWEETARRTLAAYKKIA